MLLLPVPVEVVARRRRRRRHRRVTGWVEPLRPLPPIEVPCAHCYAQPGYRCIVWDGYGWRPLPYPHYERTSS